MSVYFTDTGIASNGITVSVIIIIIMFYLCYRSGFRFIDLIIRIMSNGFYYQFRRRLDFPPHKRPPPLGQQIKRYYQFGGFVVDRKNIYLLTKSSFRNAIGIGGISLRGGWIRVG